MFNIKTAIIHVSTGGAMGQKDYQDLLKEIDRLLELDRRVADNTIQLAIEKKCGNHFMSRDAISMYRQELLV